MPLLIRDLYNNLINKSSEPFIVFPDQSCFSLRKNWHILNITDIISGSFNPLHKTHRYIYDQCMPTGRCFEISLLRKDKEFLSFESLSDRIHQFIDYAPVLITNASTYLEKIGCLNPKWNIRFHIGIDTAERIILDHGTNGVQGIKCSFIVYDRFVIKDGINVLKRFKDIENPPYNMTGYGDVMPEEYMKESSTKLRNN
jgi:hypothetical protein